MKDRLLLLFPWLHAEYINLILAHFFGASDEVILELDEELASDIRWYDYLLSRKERRFKRMAPMPGHHRKIVHGRFGGDLERVKDRVMPAIEKRRERHSVRESMKILLLTPIAELIDDEPVTTVGASFGGANFGGNATNGGAIYFSDGTIEVFEPTHRSLEPVTFTTPWDEPIEAEIVDPEPDDEIREILEQYQQRGGTASKDTQMVDTDDPERIRTDFETQRVAFGQHQPDVPTPPRRSRICTITKELLEAEGRMTEEEMACVG